jgi:small-conductance mechanosensitive channel
MAAGTPANPSLADLGQTLSGLLSRSALVEAGLLLACLAVAWVLTRLLRGTQARAGSIWFGDRIVDGVLFPALALGAAYLARWLLDDTLPSAVFKLALPILLSLLLIRITVRVLHAAFPSSEAVRVLERTVSWAVWIGLILWLTGILPIVLAQMASVRWKLGGADVSLLALAEGLLSGIAVLVGALWISASIEARLLAGAGHDGDQISMRKIAANATRALLLVAGLLLALSAAGIPLGALSVFGGALGVGIGFGLQKLAANYVSGFVILAERSLRIGDVVRVEGFEGRITDIHTRYTVIRAFNGRESIVPNEQLITQRVENASLSDPRMLLTSVVSVSYQADVEVLRADILERVSTVARVLADPPPNVLLSNFGADGLELTVAYWISDPENGQNNVRSDVNLALLKLIRERQVEIPYPQRVVHLQADASSKTSPPAATGIPGAG